jgi:3-hydroxyacyl-CoA dehydrogenase
MQNERTPNVWLIGAGVVGREILRAHIDAQVSVCLVDQDPQALREAVSQLDLDPLQWTVSPAQTLDSTSAGVAIVNRQHTPTPSRPLAIESIAENLSLKRALFANLQTWLSDDAVLCSNTSTLTIGDIARTLDHPTRCCGMHFFMPVSERPAVEIVRGPRTDDHTIEMAHAHALRIGKQPLIVGDGPGFVVNRLLSPYLNEAMLLLQRGISEARIESAALAYGMPISPLELMDWIGTRTVFDAGRVFWQSFPDRLDPSPIAPALLKRKRAGRAVGAGFYDYSNGWRSSTLAAETNAIVASYQVDPVQIDDAELMHLLAIPMWIEAVLASRQGIVSSPEQFELAMHGGLGFAPQKSWIEFFDGIGSAEILRLSNRWQARSKSLTLPTEIAQLLQQRTPRETLAYEGQNG